MVPSIQPLHSAPLASAGRSKRAAGPQEPSDQVWLGSRPGTVPKWTGEEATRLPEELSLGNDQLYYPNMFAMHFKEAGYPETHMEMVSRLLPGFADRLQGTPYELLPAQRKILEEVGNRFDMGKLEIPDELLRNGDRLSQQEQELIGRHVPVRTNRFPEGGDLEVEKRFTPYSIMEKDGARETVRHHHERWDGSGYPDGLKGHEIPLTAQVLGVCDSWDALTTKRPWRVALTPEQAAGAMRHLAQKGQFNPELVELFLQGAPGDQSAERREVAEKKQASYAWSVLRDAQDVEISLGQGYIDWDAAQRQSEQRNSELPDEPELLEHQMLIAPAAKVNAVQEGLGFVSVGGVRLRRRS